MTKESHPQPQREKESGHSAEWQQYEPVVDELEDAVDNLVREDYIKSDTAPAQYERIEELRRCKLQALAFEETFRADPKSKPARRVSAIKRKIDETLNKHLN